jgi:hypothetical protein
MHGTAEQAFKREKSTLTPISLAAKSFMLMEN